MGGGQRKPSVSIIVCVRKDGGGLVQDRETERQTGTWEHAGGTKHKHAGKACMYNSHIAEHSFARSRHRKMRLRENRKHKIKINKNAHEKKLNSHWMAEEIHARTVGLPAAAMPSASGQAKRFPPESSWDCSTIADSHTTTRAVAYRDRERERASKRRRPRGRTEQLVIEWVLT